MTAAPTETSPLAKLPNRLGFIDGLRGLSALYVALYHAAGDVPPPAPLLRLIAWPLQFGHYAVGVFIVLSGYCLMRPVARSMRGAVEGGLHAYAIRRARRILPAYYVVLLLAIAAVTIARTHYSPAAGEEADVLRLTPGTVISHLLLIHNLRPDWAAAFDPPMWSVAAECQIYVLFPLVLLPIWLRAGSFGVIAAAFSLGLAPHFLLPTRLNLDWTFPWYIGLFALGMAGASASFSRRPEEVRLRNRVPWGAAALLLGGLFAALAAWEPNLPIARLWLPDILLGCAVSALLVKLALRSQMPPNIARGAAVWSLIAGILESRPARLLGACSYSLYLLHAPILWALTCLLDILHPSAGIAFIARLLIGAPFAVGVSYAFYLLVERRFLVNG